MSKECVLITGASSGIGEGFARAFAKQGKALLLTARRTDRLEKLALVLRKETQCEILSLDLSDPAAPENLFLHCEKNNFLITGLINNAGLGRQLSFAQTPYQNIDAMLEVNMGALTKLSRLFLPNMIAQKNGFILNIASTAAFQPVPYFAVYAASKAYVLSLSESLHEEARVHGVYVGALCPGPVATEFQQVAQMEPRFFASSQQVDEVVQAGLKLLQNKKAIGWTSLFQRIFACASDLAPRTIRRKLAASLMLKAGAK